jgi:hypothetical protein
MARGTRLGWAVAVGVWGGAGCATAPPLDNPVLVRNAPDGCENPALVSPGVPTGGSYREVFEKCIDVVDDYFEILVANPYAGKIVTRPRVAPGYEQFWRAGNPDPRERLLATFQTIRKTADITITTGERGGYRVLVVVEEELEDLPRPNRQTIGASVFREAPTVDRQVEVVGEAPVAANVAVTGASALAGAGNWFRIGRDYALEQELLKRIQACK